MADEIDIITPGISLRDGCPIMRRVKAFIAYEGVLATLQYTFRTALGRPIDLSRESADEKISESMDESLSDSIQTDLDTVLVKFREFTGTSTTTTQCVMAEGTIEDRAAGVVRVRIPERIYAQSGIYTVSWGYVRDNKLRLAQNSILSIERTLFGFDTSSRARTEGPPTLGEIRMQMMDSDPNENMLLNDVEFADEQILQAIARPIQYFNEVPPPIGRWDTRNFPWKSHWLDAIAGYLNQFAAANYRRNSLTITGGGKTLNPWDKEKAYLVISQQHMDAWKEWVVMKKTEINMKMCVGTVGSDYDRSW